MQNRRAAVAMGRTAYLDAVAPPLNRQIAHVATPLPHNRLI